MRIKEILKLFKPSRSQLIGGAIILSSGLIAYAAVPHAFTGGTPISAAQVNANFADADTRITTLETNPSISGNLTLVPSTATAGNIMKGAFRFIHTFGIENTFIGVNAGNLTMTGTGNTGSGTNALFANNTGSRNTASGRSALEANATGNDNTANGYLALFSNTSGSLNMASGSGALQNNTTGGGNTANGYQALHANTNGGQNTAIGGFALWVNTIGSENTASGANALGSNSTGGGNTASGHCALCVNTTGGFNTAVGKSALETNSTGSFNIAIGNRAGVDLTTGNYNIAIGNPGVTGEANTIRIGDGVFSNVTGTPHTRAFIAGISGVNVAGVNVLVNANGQLGVAASSRKVKDNIADMGEASSTLMKLRPVTFHYKTDKNPTGRSLQYGLIAEEVAEIAPGLVARNAKGEIETVYYQHLAPMLLNEYQKQQRVIEAQAVALAKQTDRVAALEKQAQEIIALKQELARMAALMARLGKPEKVASAR
jgi:Chaperone of endosialidase